MEKKTIQINVRLGSDEFNTLQNYANDNELKQSDVIRKAIKAYIKSPNLTSKSSDLLDRINALEKRTKALEEKDFLTLKKEPESINYYSARSLPLVDFEKELLTIEEVASITGYGIKSISGVLSRNGIKKVSRIGKKGLYSKNEILEKGIQNT